MANDEPVPMLNLSAFDYQHWVDGAQLQMRRFSPFSWLNSEWFFGEIYAYRRLIEAVRWFENGRDPFLPIKRREIKGDNLWKLLDAALSVEGKTDEHLYQLLLYPLWGNRIDLSHTVSLGHGGADTAIDDDLLDDHREAIVAQLLKNSTSIEGKTHLIADNTGTELAMDLALIDFLLANGSKSVTLHVKLHPTFVSDAIPDDVWQLIDAMRQHGDLATGLADRLTAAWETGRFIIVPHLFWNSSHFLWEMPPMLYQHFSESTMTFIKGDLNYRRTIGDANWATNTPFPQIASYFPAPLVALRTLKSDGVVGVSLHDAARIEADDPEWRTNGKRGVLQMSLPNI